MARFVPRIIWPAAPRVFCAAKDDTGTAREAPARQAHRMQRPRVGQVAGALAEGIRGRRVPLRSSAIEVVALFWHFVDVAWVPIFTFIYLLPAR